MIERKERTQRVVVLRRALGIILPLCFFSFFVVALICSVTNDMYAFVKSDRECVISFNETCSLKEFSNILGEKEIIENPSIFWLYVKSKGRTESVETFTGELTLNESMSYREILSAIN